VIADEAILSALVNETEVGVPAVKAWSTGAAMRSWHVLHSFEPIFQLILIDRLGANSTRRLA
jgi:hypothetical protein